MRVFDPWLLEGAPVPVGTVRTYDGHQYKKVADVPGAGRRNWAYLAGDGTTSFAQVPDAPTRVADAAPPRRLQATTVSDEDAMVTPPLSAGKMKAIQKLPGFAKWSWGRDTPGPANKPNAVLIRFQKGTDLAGVASALKALGLTPKNLKPDALGRILAVVNASQLHPDLDATPAAPPPVPAPPPSPPIVAPPTEAPPVAPPAPIAAPPVLAPPPPPAPPAPLPGPAAPTVGVQPQPPAPLPGPQNANVLDAWKKLSTLPGYVNSQADPTSGMLHIRFDPTKTDAEAAKAAVKALGLEVHKVDVGSTGKIRVWVTPADFGVVTKPTPAPALIATKTAFPLKGKLLPYGVDTWKKALDLSAVPDPPAKDKSSKADTARAIRKAAAIMGELGMPEGITIPPVPVSLGTKKSPPSNTRGGYSYHPYTSRPLLLEVRAGSTSGGASQLITALHEMGHYLDHQLLSLGTGGLFASGSSIPEAVELQNAVKKTAGYTAYYTKGWPSKYLVYLTSQHEVFARVFSQYLLTKKAASDPACAEALARAHDTKEMGHTQWEEEDFKPLIPVMDKLLKRFGLNVEAL